jgi:hydroxymethylpyrimidine pyrophosphatase-like HAD family hydrolase
MEKPIPNFDGYTITDDGKVISYKFKNPKIMKTWKQKSGYENIKLCKNNKTYHFLIHRLVAQAFIPNPNNLPEVNHKNKCVYDNRVENLEWCTRKENLNDSYSTMSPVRNFCPCYYFDLETKERSQTFQSINEACRFLATKGYSYTSLNKYRHQKNIIIIKE